MCLGVLSTGMSVYQVHVWYLQSPGKGAISCITGVTEGGIPPPHGCWEWNLGPLEKQQAFLTAEPSLQP